VLPCQEDPSVVSGSQAVRYGGWSTMSMPTTPVYLNSCNSHATSVVENIQERKKVKHIKFQGNETSPKVLHPKQHF